MKIVLVTGIYPPEIGGPATYVRFLAQEFTKSGHVVEVVTYAHKLNIENEKWNIHVIPFGLPILRWFAYARKLKQVANDADIVYAFSSVSCGIPLILAKLKMPKKVLRLGGDFFWERYTDRGGRKSLREWYEQRSWELSVGSWILNHVDHIVFSTRFQEEIYEKAYNQLPGHSVIENALTLSGSIQHHRKPHTPFRLLFMGRFVKFKNVESLIAAMVHIHDATLTIVGEGPLDDRLRSLTENLHLTGRIRFVGPVNGKDKEDIFAKHDLLVLPSLTEISPNTALEAKAAGLPVLLTHQHGLGDLSSGMIDSTLYNISDIVDGIAKARTMYVANYSTLASRPWSQVASETVNLFATLLRL
ncbi:MAG: glycosyltransferase family 4 protein [Candidatus Peregrinibacteria bacterium]|nr:glycosyltransferase family 4 protein [Candidatus Peregrinibacteria bacterium]MCB9808054.1 glycosyltransferase family 4 protein [Candidatus Peribacteria bacterium]